MLEIKNLHVNVDGREILNGLDLTLPQGEVHAIMGPNGSGKSTLAYVLAGKADYEVTAGTVTWNGKDLLAMDPSARAVASSWSSFFRMALLSRSVSMIVSPEAKGTRSSSASSDATLRAVEPSSR